MSDSHDTTVVKPHPSFTDWVIRVRRIPTDHHGCTHMAMAIHPTHPDMFQAWGPSEEDVRATLARVIGGL